QEAQLALAADERRVEPGTAADAAAGGGHPHRPPQRHRRRLALQLELPGRLRDDGGLGDPARGLVDEDPAGRRRALDARGGVHEVAGHDALADGPDGHGGLARGDPGAGGEGRAGALAEGAHGVDQLEGDADGPLAVVLLRERGAPDGHDRIADEFLDGAAVALDRAPGGVEVAGEELAHLLRVARAGERREADQVGEEHRHHPPLGCRRLRRRHGRGRGDERRPAGAAEAVAGLVRRAACGACHHELGAAARAVAPPLPVLAQAGLAAHRGSVEQSRGGCRAWPRPEPVGNRGPVLVFAVAAGSGWPFPVCPRTPGASTAYAYDQSARATSSPESGRQDQDAGPAWRTPEAGRLHARVHGHAQEAELGPPQGGPRAPDEPDGGHGLHPRRRPQPAGALGRSHPRRPRQGPPWRPLQDHPRRARHLRCQRPQAGALEVRGQEELVVPRRAEITPRPLLRDPVYESVLVTQVVNRVMQDGKKSVAENIVYKALESVGQKTGQNPVEVLERAIKSVTPVLEVRSRRVGGANYQVPIEVPQRRARTLAVRWLVTFSRQRREKQAFEKLAGEILDATNQQGGAFKRKDDMYRMAQANKAFAHYRW